VRIRQGALSRSNQRFGDPKIQHLDDLAGTRLPVKEQVARLQVTVDYPG
jgi:hypothetical protein